MMRQKLHMTSRNKWPEIPISCLLHCKRWISSLGWNFLSKLEGEDKGAHPRTAVVLRKDLDVGITVCYQLHVLPSSEQGDKIVLQPSHATSLLPELLFHHSVVSHEKLWKICFCFTAEQQLFGNLRAFQDKRSFPAQLTKHSAFWLWASLAATFQTNCFSLLQSFLWAQFCQKCLDLASRT